MKSSTIVRFNCTLNTTTAANKIETNSLFIVGQREFNECIIRFDESTVHSTVRCPNLFADKHYALLRSLARSPNKNKMSARKSFNTAEWRVHMVHDKSIIRNYASSCQSKPLEFDKTENNELWIQWLYPVSTPFANIYHSTNWKRNEQTLCLLW